MVLRALSPLGRRSEASRKCYSPACIPCAAWAPLGTVYQYICSAPTILFCNCPSFSLNGPRIAGIRRKLISVVLTLLRRHPRAFDHPSHTHPPCSFLDVPLSYVLLPVMQDYAPDKGHTSTKTVQGPGSPTRTKSKEQSRTSFGVDGGHYAHHSPARADQTVGPTHPLA